MRHYKQLRSYARGAMIASSDLPFMEVVQKYNPAVRELPLLSESGAERNLNGTNGYVIHGATGKKTSVRSPDFELARQPAQVYFEQLSDNILLVGVRVDNKGAKSPDEVLDDIIRRTNIRELDSVFEEVKSYFEMRHAAVPYQ